MEKFSLIELPIIYQCVIISISQFLFIYLRTINITHTISASIKATLISSFLVSITWLLSTSLGVTALIQANWWVVTCYLIFGLLGNYLALKNRDKHKNH